MMITQQVVEKDGKLCFCEIEIHTGIHHYYPIRARVEIQFNVNFPMFLPDPYLYVDREQEL